MPDMVLNNWLKSFKLAFISKSFLIKNIIIICNNRSTGSGRVKVDKDIRTNGSSIKVFEGEDYEDKVTNDSLYIYYQTKSAHVYNPSKVTCNICFRTFRSERNLQYHVDRNCQDKQKFFPVSRIISMEDTDPGTKKN